MSETVIDNYLVAQVHSHAGLPVTAEVIEAVLPDAEKAVKDAQASGKDLPLEFALATAARALWAEAHQGQFGKQLDWPAYVREKLAKKDSLFSKLFQRKSKVQQQIADLKQYEEEINGARGALRASEVNAKELRDSIAATEHDLELHTETAVEGSIQQAAEIWEHRGRSPHNSSIVDAAVSHAVEAEVINRILSARLIWLKDKLATEEKKIEAIKRQLKDLEKQTA
jgi:chaperonin cofactor prefoldin